MNFKKITIFAQTLAILLSLVNINTCAYYSLNTESSTENALQITTKTEQQGNKSDGPKVSIIVPVYNAEKYLDECLNSAQNQKFENDTDIDKTNVNKNKDDVEIICVNDGSKDKSLDILKEHQKNDDRIIIIDKKNAGVAAARNDGLKAAKGEYVAFLDSDDYIDKDTYKTAYKRAKEEDADIVCFGWKNFTNDGSKPPRKDCILEDQVFSDWREAKKYRASVLSWNKLYKRSILEEHELRFNPEIKIAEDECFNLCVYPFTKKIVHISAAPYHYRVNPSSATLTMSFKFMVKNYLKVWAKVNEFYKLNNIKCGIFFRLFYFQIYKEDFFPVVIPSIKNLFF